MVSALSAGGSPAGCPVLLALTVPVNDIIGLFGANDAQRVDCCVRGRKVWVLARAPSKATFWALTQLQELTHARYTARGKDKVRQHSFQNTKFHQSMPFQASAFLKREETSPPHLVNIYWIQSTPVKGLIL